MKKSSLLLLASLLLSSTTMLRAQPPRPHAAGKSRPSAKKTVVPAAARTYYLVLLKAPKSVVADPEATATTRAAHMAYLQQLRQEGKLALAGSCPGPQQELQTMYLLKVPTLSEAQGLMAADPGVKMGPLTAEVYPWVRQPDAGL